MALWKASLRSGEATGTALIRADTLAQAKNSVFNQFLNLEYSSIAWLGQPTFWVLCLSLQPVDKAEAADEA